MNQPRGKIHFRTDAFCANPKQLSSTAWLGERVHAACAKFDLIARTERGHEFTPIGATLMLELRAALIVVHTWPEFAGVTVDIYARDSVDYTQLLREIVEQLGCESSLEADSLAVSGTTDENKCGQERIFASAPLMVPAGFVHS